MITFLDLLVIVFMALIVASLLALCLMFLARKPKLKRVCFFIVAALAIYASTIGIRIGFGLFPIQTTVGFLMIALAVIAIVVNLLSKEDKKKRNISNILGAAALIIAVVNAIL